MKAQRNRSFVGKLGRGPKQITLLVSALLLMLLSIVSCASKPVAGAILVGVAAGIALAILLRMALNFDPEE
ncbi:hypothetical protein KK141_08625 [Dyella sp. LX-66]|uniref:hypothetical protein n=1 Tax=unclassified Dyella TaxID=2634549 RepID=UPI001BE11520|nr:MULTISPECIES: hypothetical protein [unclassified Dyella]MBT2115779.1 hypothetical protein [Dyella sp. LX-1]MBT2139594.1 hypothetical protein [Dyella sp. LX-66]